MTFQEKVERAARQHVEKVARCWLAERQARTSGLKSAIDSVEPKSPPLFDVLTGKERILPGK